jgi:ubiquinone/menaquinone biosynthesis C-methylase UbiE
MDGSVPMTANRSPTDYSVDIEYGSAFSPFQAPSLIGLTASLGGFHFDYTSPFTFLDIGCGDGTSALMIAASYPHARVIGVDLNPNHIERAVADAKSGQVDNATFLLADISQLADLDIGVIDMASVAGLFTWLDRERQRQLLKALSLRLRPGGLLHLHYASQPGAAQTDALHRAMRILAPKTGGSIDQLAGAIAALRPATEKGMRFFERNPLAAARLRSIIDGNPADEAHDVMNHQDGGLWFADVDADLAEAGFQHVGDTDLTVDTPDLHQNDALGEALRLPAGPRRETLKDLVLNRASRQDVFVRLPGRSLAVADRSCPSSVYVTPRGTRLSADSRRALGSMAGDAERQLARLMSDPTAVLPAAGPDGALCCMLMALGLLAPCVEAPRPLRRDARGLSAFNAFQLARSLRTGVAGPLASPVLGSRIVLPIEDLWRLAAWTGLSAELIGEGDPAARRQAERLLGLADQPGLGEAFSELSVIGVLQ